MSRAFSSVWLSRSCASRSSKWVPGYSARIAEEGALDLVLADHDRPGARLLEEERAIDELVEDAAAEHVAVPSPSPAPARASRRSRATASAGIGLAVHHRDGARGLRRVARAAAPPAPER